MGNALFCDVCGKSSKVHIKYGKGGKVRNLCFDCHNREMAELYDSDMPDHVPEKLMVTGRNGKPHEFDIEFIIFGTGKSLTATEVGKTKRKADVWSSLDDDFDEMLDTLKKRIKKALSVKCMDQNGRIKDQKLVGYIDYDRDSDECVIFIDGKSYTWGELGRNIPLLRVGKSKLNLLALVMNLIKWLCLRVSGSI